MEDNINELIKKYSCISIILHTTNKIFLEINLDEVIYIEIDYKDNYPDSVPSVKVMNKNKYMSIGAIPNDFGMTSLDINWKGNLICIFDEILANIKK